MTHAIQPDLQEHVLPLLTVPGELTQAVPFGNGHINNTYLLTFQQADGTSRRYILQQINTSVFQEPEHLMENILSVCSYLKEKISSQGGDADRECLTFLPFADGKYLVYDKAGRAWRYCLHIENSVSYDLPENPSMMESAGRAFGLLQTRLDGYPADSLWETIPHFHDTSRRYQAFLQAVREDSVGRAAGVQEEILFWTRRHQDFSRLRPFLEKNLLPLRVTHNDTKLNNVLFDKDTHAPLCVIDLDTVMPGLSLYDFGDALRSGANTAAEDEIDLSKVSFSLEVYEAFTKGFLSQTSQILSSAEKELLPFSAKLMTMECGIRFLTDYLQGDVYFKIHRPQHNLDRCRTQIKLVQDMEAKMSQMNDIFRKCL